MNEGKHFPWRRRHTIQGRLGPIKYDNKIRSNDQDDTIKNDDTSIRYYKNDEQHCFEKELGPVRVPPNFSQSSQVSSFIII